MYFKHGIPGSTGQKSLRKGKQMILIIVPAYCLKKVSQTYKGTRHPQQTPMVSVNKEDKAENLGSSYGLEFSKQSIRIKRRTRKAPDICTGFLYSLLFRTKNCINIRNYLRLGKHLPERSRWKSLRDHTRPGVVHVPTRYSRSPW